MANNFYPHKSTEISLRDELINTLDGVGIEISKKRSVLLRKMRRDSDNNLTLCPCVDPTTGEADRDFFCAICYGEKYLWDESWITAYRKVITKDHLSALHLQLKQVGLLDVKTSVFWLRYSEDISNIDKIVEVNLNADGTVPTNPIRTVVWRINLLDELRLDNARVEFYKAFCSQEDVRFLNPPTE